MEDASRVFWLRQSVGLEGGNDDTWFAPAHGAAAGVVGELFFEHYDAVRDWVSRHRRAGLAVMSLSTDGIEAKAFLRASERAINTAIIGRHNRADISLSGDPSLSLRHVAVIVAPHRGEGEPMFRLVDLRTASGFVDHEGRSVRACESREPVFIRCGSHPVLFAPTSRTSPAWPEDPEEMWSLLHKRRAATLEPTTLDDCLLAHDEEAMGELVLRSEEGEGRMLVGRRAARGGLLLGRSDRCDGDALLRDPHISRVHLLLVEIERSLYAIDTASKNGVWGRGVEHRAHLLESGTTLSLCGRATFEWRFIH